MPLRIAIIYHKLSFPKEPEKNSRSYYQKNITENSTSNESAKRNNPRGVLNVGGISSNIETELKN